MLSAEVEASKFKDVDALVLTNFADNGFSPAVLANYSIEVANCMTMPLNQAGSGSPTHYQYRERTAPMFVQTI